MPFIYITRVGNKLQQSVIRRDITKTTKPTKTEVGQDNGNKSSPDRIKRPGLSPCCAANPECLKAYNLLSDPLDKQDTYKYNSWRQKNAAAQLICNDKKI